VKVIHDATRLTGQLGELGWRFEVEETAIYFIYGRGHKEAEVW
jgi:hypothetical protein